MKLKIFKKAGAAALSMAMLTNAAAFSTVVADAADSTATKYEFEDAEITGTGSVKKDADASGGAYFYLESNSDTATLTVEVPSTGMYEIGICYNAAFGEKIQNLYVNGVDQGQISFTSKTWTEVSCGSVKLNKGENKIMIKSSWGWTNFDYLTVKSAELPEIKATQPYTTDEKAIIEAQNLMAYFAEVYGSHIISGQQEIYQYGPHGLETEFEYLNELTGHYPAIRGFDYGNFTCPAFGSDDGSTKRIIDWVKNKNGIATASWHLNVPNKMENYTVGDKIAWDQTSYTAKDNDFKPSNVYKEGTKEYEYYLMALKTLAAEFNKLEAEGIPVVWRPLHEAEGGGGEKGSWFWWGKEGSAVYKELWKYTYKVLTEDFNCHNLIWEWNSYNYETSANWYPGDEYVDIIGYDKYNCTDWSTGSAQLVHNDSAISSTFYGIMQKYNSTKMISMAENDCFSTVDNLKEEKAGWLYFCTWYDGGSDDINYLSNPMFNTEEDTIAMYQSDYCLTLDELPADLYTKSGDIIRTTISTTTTTTTTADPSITTTTTEPVYKFEAKSYKVELPAPEYRDKIFLTIEGAPTASIGGAIGYGTSAADWTNIDWSGNADSKGKLSVTVDISEIPASIKNAEVQIWWSNVWDNEKEAADDADCELVDHLFIPKSTDVDPIVYGDANCDGEVSLADAVLILQSIANSDKYGVNGTEKTHITKQGLLNADCCDHGDGLTPKDALSVQKYLSKLVELPEVSEEK